MKLLGLKLNLENMFLTDATIMLSKKSTDRGF